MTDILTRPFPGYELIDSGNGRKLESIAGLLVDRPSPSAVWRPALGKAKWSEARSVCIRTPDGGGRWEHRQGDPGDIVLPWSCPGASVRFVVRLTAFGHCGLFFEQDPIWRMLAELISSMAKVSADPPKVLNLFGYTGAASLVAAAAGAEVFHVDSAKGVLNWGRQGMEGSPETGRRIRWVHDDARAFLKHSLRKGFRYQIVLADPPSWGHGTDKEVWEIEEGLQSLIDDCHGVLDAERGHVILVSHSHGFQGWTLANVLATASPGAAIASADLGIAHRHDSRILPAGLVGWAARRPGDLPAAMRVPCATETGI